MRVPGVHVLLTAGVVAITSVGTVTAFSLTGAATSTPELPAVAPPPAAAAPALPAPPPPPAPAPTSEPSAVADEEQAAEPTRAPRTRSDDDEGRFGRGFPFDDEPRQRKRDRSSDDDRPGRGASDNGRFRDQVEYACAHDYVDREYCRGRN